MCHVLLVAGELLPSVRNSSVVYAVESQTGSRNRLQLHQQLLYNYLFCLCVMVHNDTYVNAG